MFAVLVGGGCHNNTARVGSSSVLPIEDVLANPQSFAHRIITGRACFIVGFERATLQPCQSPRPEQFVWVTNAAKLWYFEKLQLPSIRIPEPPGLKALSKSALLFDYDDAKNSAAWRKLTPESKRRLSRSDVTVVGQFETIAPNTAVPMSRGFGHLNGYSHELILVDVLRSEVLDNR